MNAFRTALLLCAAPCLPLPASAGSIQLFSFGPDANNYPINLTEFDQTASTVSSQGNLSNGSYFYNGGLVLAAIGNSGALYAIGNDVSGDGGNDQFAEFIDPNVGATNVVALDPTIGWTGGLTYDPGTGLFYAVGINAGIPTLYSIDTTAHSVSSLFAVGDGSVGFSGLAYDSTNQLFYAVANGATDQLMTFDINHPGLATPALSLGGTGYLGGLAYDPANDRFYLIQSQGPSAEAFLVRVALSSGVTQSNDMGMQGFVNAGIAISETGFGGGSGGNNPTPEPSMSVVLAAIFAFACFSKAGPSQSAKEIRT